jgi:hypothetical protein
MRGVLILEKHQEPDREFNLIYQVIVRGHWSQKISPLFIVVFGLSAIVNFIMILYREKK